MQYYTNKNFLQYINANELSMEYNVSDNVFLLDNLLIYIT